MKFFNTTLGLSMLSDGCFEVVTLNNGIAKEFLTMEYKNVANPTHANSLQAISQKLGVESVLKAEGGRIALRSGDECLVAEISGIPRETREFTNEEIAAAIFKFRLVTVK